MTHNLAADDPQARQWFDYVATIRDDPPPFEQQWRRFNEIYADRRPELGPPPAWLPTGEQAAASNIGQLMAEHGFATYEDLHSWSVKHRAEFWNAAIKRLGISFHEQPTEILDLENGPADPQWLPGAQLNIVDSCFTQPPETTAIISGSETSTTPQTTTFSELEELVNRIANGLHARGLGSGDGVALYMPMTTECVAAYLGALRAGCFVVSIADSFSATEVAKRLRIGGARALITVQSFTRGGRNIELYATACAADGPPTVVIPTTPGHSIELRPDDLLWQDFLCTSTEAPQRAAAPDEVANVLFSSGTTGEPKAIPWTHLTPVKCAMDGHYHHDIRTTDVVAWPTNIGWMMGPWLIFASLINGAAIALFEGSPGSVDFAHFIEQAEVTVLGVVPSLVRAWRASSACDHADWNSVRVLSSTGEPSNSEDYLWLMSRSSYQAPVIEYCGGTEIGGAHLTGTVVQAASPATFSTPALGLDVAIIDGHGEEVQLGAGGELFVLPPSIGLSQRLLNADHHAIYYADCPEVEGIPILRRHGDQVARLGHGYFRAQGRADDTMNLGGIKVSSRELEAVIDTHPSVFESAAVGFQPTGEGAEVLVIFVVPGNQRSTEELRNQVQALIRKDLNPLFKIHRVVLVDALPRTASNKIMRRELRARYREELA